MPPEDIPLPHLSAALAKAQGAAKAVGRDGENKHHGYRYASAESIIDEGRLAFSSVGLSLVPSTTEIVARELCGVLFVLVRATYILSHESGESMRWTREWPAIEQKGRPLDKAVAGAITSALAYTIRDALLLPRDDDMAAMDRRDDSGHVPGAKPLEMKTRAMAAVLEDSSTSGNVPTPEELEGLINQDGVRGADLSTWEAFIPQIEASTEAKDSLRFLVRAWRARTREEFGVVGAEIRRSMPKVWADLTLARIRPAFDACGKAAA